MINAALIGKGYWGSKLERYIQANEVLNLARSCDSRTDLSREVFHDPSIDAIIVATPKETHYEIAKEALINGKHVMCEKPLALRTEQCKDLGRSAEEHSVFLCTDYTYTFSRSLELARGIVNDGGIGKLYCIEMQMKQWGRFGIGDAYLVLGSHLLSVLDMFIPLDTLEFDKTEPVAHGDAQTGSILFAGDSTEGYLSVSLNHPNKVRSVAIYGDRGTIVYDPLSKESLVVIRYDLVPGEPEIPANMSKQAFGYDESNNLGRAMDYFFEVINGRAESNIRRATAVTQVLEGLNGG